MAFLSMSDSLEELSRIAVMMLCGTAYEFGNTSSCKIKAVEAPSTHAPDRKPQGFVHSSVQHKLQLYNLLS